MECNIIVAGVGGQGSILASHIIAEAAILQHGDKYHARVGETFGAAQRGGAVSSHVRIGEEVYGPLLGAGTAQLLLAMEPAEALRVGVSYLAPDGLVILNPGKQIPVDVKVGAVEYPEVDDIVAALEKIGKKVVVIDGAELAEQAGSPKVLSIVMLGAAVASGKIPVDAETMLQAVLNKVPKKTVDMNAEAFKLGQEAYLSAIAE